MILLKLLYKVTILQNYGKYIKCINIHLVLKTDLLKNN